VTSRRDRDLERVQRLLRKVDMEEVLEELGIEVLWYNGPDVYAECPDPDHEDEHPSFHVCVEDEENDEGRCRLGWFNCWSHPDDSMRGFNFLDLVAKIKFDLWGEREDGKLNWPNEEQRSAAAAWIRREFLNREGFGTSDPKIENRRIRSADWTELLFPPNKPIDEAEESFQRYLERRFISPERARELDVRVVYNAGERLKTAIGKTVPGVLFPIRWEGRVVNWYLRGTTKRLASNLKGRYCPGLPLGKGAGVLWAPDGIVPGRPVVLVEGNFDAERVRGIVENHGFDYSVAATLGGRLYAAQAKHLRTAPFLIHMADGDEGGETLAKTVEEQLGSFTRVAVRQLPAGTDPGDADEAVILDALRPPAEVARVRVRFRTGVRRS